jgi:hypothetical protein
MLPVLASRAPHLVASLVLLAATATSAYAGDTAPAAAAAAAVPPVVEIKGASLAGTGCAAQQIAAATLSADKQSFTLAMPDLRAEAKATGLTGRVKCNGIVVISHTPGWQLAVTKAEFDLRAKVLATTDAEVVYSHIFQGRAGETAGMAKAIRGDLPGEHHVFDFPELWSTCGSGTTMEPGIEIRVPNALKKPAGQVNWLEAYKALKITMKWQKC